MMQTAINIEFVCADGGETQSGITGKESTQQGTTTDACAYLYD